MHLPSGVQPPAFPLHTLSAFLLSLAAKPTCLHAVGRYIDVSCVCGGGRVVKV